MPKEIIDRFQDFLYEDFMRYYEIIIVCLKYSFILFQNYENSTINKIKGNVEITMKIKFFLFFHIIINKKIK